MRMTTRDALRMDRLLATFSEEEKRMMAKTACGGSHPYTRVTPKLLIEYYREAGKDRIASDLILDFGCGLHSKHIEMLREIGCNAVGFDFALPDTIGNIYRKYDRILVANVLNVQPTPAALHITLQMLKLLCKPEGEIWANYPNYPRKANLSLSKALEIIQQYFDTRLIRKTNLTYILTHKRKTI